MEKIRLYDGTVVEIQDGSTEYEISTISHSIDKTASLFTDSNLEQYEILTETDEVCSIYTKKHLRNFKAEVIDGGYLITLVLVDRDELYERVAELESLVAILTAANEAEDIVFENDSENNETTETDYIEESEVE